MPPLWKQFSHRSPPAYRTEGRESRKYFACPQPALSRVSSLTQGFALTFSVSALLRSDANFVGADAAVLTHAFCIVFYLFFYFGFLIWFITLAFYIYLLLWFITLCFCLL